MICAVSGGFGHYAGKLNRGVARRNEIQPMADSGRRSDLAVVPEIDHRVREGLECVVQPASTLETQQWPLELVLPGKHPLDRPEALFEGVPLQSL
jgi:hypothetical protein